MADVQFNDNYGYNQNYGQQKVPKLVGWVMKTGLAKDVRRANMILIGIAIVAVVLAFMVYPRSAPIPDASDFQDLPPGAEEFIPQ